MGTIKKKVAIIGGGFTGLAAAYELSKRKDLEVYLFEKETKPGGLGRGYRQPNWQWSLEEYYHHLFTSDSSAQKIAAELGIPLLYKRPVTAIYNHGNILPFDSPFDLIRYPYLNFLDKIRVGLVLGYFKLSPFWKHLEKETAKNWLSKTMGVKAWKELWEPLFIGKFGKYSDKIAASWFYGRIKKRSSSLGYPEAGFQTFADKLEQEILKRGGKVFYNTEIKEALYKNNHWQIRVKNRKNSPSQLVGLNPEFVISTVATPVFIDIFPQLSNKYTQKLSSINYLYSQTLVLELQKPFLPPLNQPSAIFPLSSIIRNPPARNASQSDAGGSSSSLYWLNINDNSFPFLAVVEHTNFMNAQHYGGNHLLYIGNYLPENHPYLKKSAEELFEIFKPYLLKINPDFKFQISNFKFQIFTSPYSQPVVTTDYPSIRPSLSTPLPNLYLGNLDCVYPWDRGVNYAIELGNKLAELL